MGTALAFAMKFMSALPDLIDAGMKIAEVKSLIDSNNGKLKTFADEKRDPTDAEWAELNASIETKRKELHT